MTIYFLVAIVIIAALALLHKKKRKVPDEPEQPNQMQDPPEPIAVEVLTEFPVHWFEHGVRKEGIAKVIQGLQVFDANGKCTVDVTDRLTKYLGKATIDETQAQGVISDPNITSQGDLWYVIIKATGETLYEDAEFPELTKETGVIRWQYLTEYRTGGDIIYGVY